MTQNFVKKFIDYVCEDDGINMIKVRKPEVNGCVETVAPAINTCVNEVGQKLKENYNEKEPDAVKCEDYATIFTDIRQCIKDNIMTCSSDLATVLDRMMPIIVDEIRVVGEDHSKCDAFFNILFYVHYN